MNLYHVTKIFPYFPFNRCRLYTKISSFMPVLTIGIVRDCFYLLIFYSEKFSTWVWRLPFAVNGNLNLPQMGDKGGGGRSSRPWDKGWGARSWKKCQNVLRDYCSCNIWTVSFPLYLIQFCSLSRILTLFIRNVWSWCVPQMIFWDRGEGLSESRKFVDSRYQRFFHFSNVLCTALSLNIPRHVLPLHIWCKKLVPPNKDFCEVRIIWHKEVSLSTFFPVLQCTTSYIVDIPHQVLPLPGPGTNGFRRGVGSLGSIQKVPEGISRELWWRVSL